MDCGWLLALVKGIHFKKSFGGCNKKGNSLQAEAVGILSISIFVALMMKH